MTKDEERAVLIKRLETIAEAVRQRKHPTVEQEQCHYALLDAAEALKSLPLESKEVEAEPVAWMTDRGNLLHASVIEFHRQNNIDAAGRFNIPLYTTPQPCPKCAEFANEVRVQYLRAETLERELTEANAQHDLKMLQLQAAEAKWTAEKHVRQQTQERLAKVREATIETAAMVCEYKAGMGAYAESMGAFRILHSAAAAIRALKEKP